MSTLLSLVAILANYQQIVLFEGFKDFDHASIPIAKVFVNELR
jgi:molybdopterin-guanine dinucleotide biosynthesis protein